MEKVLCSAIWSSYLEALNEKGLKDSLRSEKSFCLINLFEYSS